MSSAPLDDTIYIDKNNALGSGSFGAVFPASVTGPGQGNLAAKLVPLPLDRVATMSVREVKYQSFAATHAFDTVTRTVRATDAYTGVPKIHRALVDDSANACILQDLVSNRPLQQIINRFSDRDLSPLVYSWLVQALYILAALEAEGIMHRDIKPQHLRIARDGTLALIDWGLATQHADNSFLTQYTITYMYRPPEVFYYCAPFLHRYPEWEPIAPGEREHPIVSSRAPHHIRDTVGANKVNSLSGPHMPAPYSTEADMYSLGLAFIETLLGVFPLKTNYRLPLFYRHKQLMRKVFKWRQICPKPLHEDSWSSVDRCSTDLKRPDVSLSFADILSAHWDTQLSKGEQSVLCPFSSRQEALDVCTRGPDPLAALLNKCNKFSRPEWVKRFLNVYGFLILAMCHPDPDKRPTAASLVAIMSRGLPLEHWQAESRALVGPH